MAKATIILHSGDYDKVYSALIIGNGALAMGMECSIYFTFWGLQRLRKGQLSSGPLSKMHMLGLGKWFMKRKMKQANVASLERLMKDYKELGGKIIACDMTMEVMGLKKEDLDESLITECGAVGTYIKEARESDITLFI
jgi:peroxiredoxin family protein